MEVKIWVIVIRALLALLRNYIDELHLKIDGDIIACYLKHGDARILAFIRCDSRRNKHVVKVKFLFSVVHVEHIVAWVVS